MQLSLTLLTLMLAASHQSTLKEFAVGNNLLTADIYKEVVKDAKVNAIVSPLSVEIVLALVQLGAKGSTAEELQAVLHLPAEARTKAFFDALFTALKEQQSCQLSFANKIYAKKDLQVKKAFTKLAQDTFKADLEIIDFTEAVSAANTINKWVERQTNFKIRDLLDPKVLNPTTSMVLVNALYFKGTWMSTFEATYTRKEKFYRTSKDVIQMDGMYMHARYHPYCESVELKAKLLKKEFQGGKMAMVLVLPNDKEGLMEVEQKAEKVFAEEHIFQDEKVNVMLPKFKIETKIMFTEIMKKLGVTKAFSRDAADFGGIIEKNDSLVIDEIAQKAFIDVNEEGVEVAVATDLSMMVGSSLHKEKPKEFIADHPFLYYIEFEGVILFAGKVSSPTY